MPTPLTVVIPTLNEEAQIGECVRHLAWAGEVIVADGGSTDGTGAAARAAGARVIAAQASTIAGQRNVAIAQAKHEWVFALDADERIGPELAAELGAAVAAPRHEAYAVRRRNVYLGRVMRYGGWGNNWTVRLFRRDRRFVERRVHEGLAPVADVGRLTHPMEHTPYTDLAHHWKKLTLYAAWGAQDLADRGRRARLGDVLVRPPFAFFRSYVLQLGVLEGWRGAVLCGLAAVSVFLKYARLWELDHHGDG
jgi:glycosyltransferase involved in cell wall biosynthesis